MAAALETLCRDAHQAVRGDYNILILSDRATGPDRIAIPALLATSAVHHHLIREGERTESGIVVETGEAREVHNFCLLAGYGAEAVNPYLALETIQALRDDLPASANEEKAAAAEIGRAHVCTPVTNAHIVCRLFIEKKNIQTHNSNL